MSRNGLLVLCSVVLIFCHSILSRQVSQPSDTSTNIPKPSVSIVSPNVYEFTHYHLYFKTTRAHMNTNTEELCRANENNLEINNNNLNYYTNQTDIYINTKLLNRCANEFYFPKVVSPNQISWKRVEKKKSASSTSTSRNSSNVSSSSDDSVLDDVNVSTKDSINAKFSLLNATLLLNFLKNSGGKNFFSHYKKSYYNLKKEEINRSKQAHENQNGEEEDNEIEDPNKNETVHKYMAFGLLLPNHPFSNQMLHHLKIVAPMFPNVKLVIGNGYEFKQLCSQYGVSSFPQLLLFTEGLLKGKLYSDGIKDGFLSTLARSGGNLDSMNNYYNNKYDSNSLSSPTTSSGKNMASSSSSITSSPSSALSFFEKMTPETMALEFSKWTKTFPKSYPNTIRSRSTIDDNSYGENTFSTNRNPKSSSSSSSSSVSSPLSSSFLSQFSSLYVQSLFNLTSADFKLGNSINNNTSINTILSRINSNIQSLNISFNKNLNLNLSLLNISFLTSLSLLPLLTSPLTTTLNNFNLSTELNHLTKSNNSTLNIATLLKSFSQIYSGNSSSQNNSKHANNSSSISTIPQLLSQLKADFQNDPVMIMLTDTLEMLMLWNHNNNPFHNPFTTNPFRNNNNNHNPFSPFNPFQDHGSTASSPTNKIRTIQNPNHSDNPFNPYSLSSFMYLVHGFVLTVLQKIRLPYSLEPIMGTFESLTEYDKNGLLWLLSGFYVLIRMIILPLITLYRKWRVQQHAVQQGHERQ